MGDEKKYEIHIHQAEKIAIGDHATVINGASPAEGERAHLTRALENARRALAILEAQAAGYTSLTIPAHLKIELEDKRREVEELERRLK